MVIMYFDIEIEVGGYRWHENKQRSLVSTQKMTVGSCCGGNSCGFGRGSGSSCSTFELILFFLHTSTNDWTYCCSLSIIFTLFVPFHLDIPRIVRASLIGIPISGKSLAYMCGLQVWTRVLYYSGKVKIHYAFQLIQIHFLSKWFRIYLHRIDFR